MPPLLAQRVRDVIYPRSVAQLDNFIFTVKSQTGSPFTGITSDFVAYPVAVHGYFNWRNVAIARAVCVEGDMIIEVGANVGSETVAFSDIVGQSGSVKAFEPFPPNLEQLRLNAAQTRHRNVTVFPLALSDRDANVRFVVPFSDNSGRGHVVGPEDHEPLGVAGGELEVRCTTLDSLMSGLGVPRLIVVDAEGHEGAILRGADESLRRHQPIIVLEVVARLLARARSSPIELARHLQGLGYDLFEITRTGVARINVQAGAIPDASDWVAIPVSASDVSDRIRHTIQRCGLMPCLAGVSPLRDSAPRGLRLGS